MHVEILVSMLDVALFSFVDGELLLHTTSGGNNGSLRCLREGRLSNGWLRNTAAGLGEELLDPLAE